MDNDKRNLNIRFTYFYILNTLLNRNKAEASI
jgi:hypothetical protein